MSAFNRLTRLAANPNVKRVSLLPEQERVWPGWRGELLMMDGRSYRARARRKGRVLDLVEAMLARSDSHAHAVVGALYEDLVTRSQSEEGK